MAITFNTNVSAMTSQRYLGIAADKTASSLAKLSSGSRVPTAKDDAAALAIGSKLKAEVTSLNQAGNNASQAVSLLQIADGAFSTTADILNRMKSLAVQASSGQLADAERGLLNQEFTNLRSEVDRIAQVTNFNGNQLLNGGDSVASAAESQAGFLQGKGIQLSFDTDKLGADQALRVSYDWTDAATDTGMMTVTNLSTGASQSVDIAKLIQAQTAEAATDLTNNLGAGKSVDVKFEAIGVTLKLDSTFDVNTDVNTNALGVTVSSSTVITANPSASFQTGARVSGTQLAAMTTLSSVTGKLGVNVTATAANTLTFAATAGLEFSTNGTAFAATATGVATNAAGAGVFVRATGSTDAFAFINLATTTTAATGSAQIELDVSGIARVQEATTATKTFAFKVGTGTTSNDSISFTLNAATTSALGINSSSIDTAANANTAITAVSTAINTVASRRADIGANQSRLDFAAASIAVAVENTTAAKSALTDVDVSAEMTEFSSQQVLLQAGISLLAQANQQPGLLLRLLQ